MYTRLSNATWSVAHLSLSLDHAVTTQPASLSITTEWKRLCK